MNRIVPNIIVFALIILAWESLSLSLGAALFPSPADTLVFFIQELVNGLWFDMMSSLYRVTMGLIIAITIAYPLGIIAGHELWIDRLLSPFLQLFYPIPKIIFLPIIFILFGIGDLSKIILIAIKAGFQMLVITHDFSKNLSHEHFDSLKSMGAKRWQIYYHVLLPSSLPSLFTALRINLGTALAILFICESYATKRGIGAFIMDAFGRFNAKEMMAGSFALALLGIFLFVVLNVLERILCPWARAQVKI